MGGGERPPTRPDRILGTCEHVTFHAKRDFTGGRMLKDQRWETMLGPSGRREAEGQRRGDNGGMWGPGLRMQHFYELEKARNGVCPEPRRKAALPTCFGLLRAVGEPGCVALSTESVVTVSSSRDQDLVRWGCHSKSKAPGEAHPSPIMLDINEICQTVTHCHSSNF